MSPMSPYFSSPGRMFLSGPSPRGPGLCPSHLSDDGRGAPEHRLETWVPQQRHGKKLLLRLVEWVVHGLDSWGVCRVVCLVGIQFVWDLGIVVGVPWLDLTKKSDKLDHMVVIL